MIQFHLIQNLGFGGAESILLSYVQSSQDPHIIFTLSKISLPLSLNLPVNVRVLNCGIFSFSGFPLFCKFLFKSITSKSIRFVLWSYKPSLLVLPLSPFFCIKPISYIHSTVDPSSWTRLQLLSSTLFKYLVFFFNSHVIFCSRSSLISNTLSAGTNHKLLYAGASFLRYPFKDRMFLLEKPRVLRLLSVTKDCPLKDPFNLIQALSYIDAKNLPFVLDLIGSGTDSELFTQQFSHLSYFCKINFHGCVDCVVDFYHSSSLFVCSSSNESLPMAIIEAQLTGLPVLSTNVGDIPYLIQDQSLLVPAKDPEALAQAIIRFYTISSLDYLSYSKAISIRMQNNFSSSLFFDNLRNIILK